MNCPRCGTANSAGRRFCAECGSSLASTCPTCGFSNEPGAKFCGGCGAAVGASPATVGPRFASPETYTPKHLAEKILTSKSALEGERKQITVLFADLKGSMELLADLDPEDARKLIDPVLEHMMEAVHRFEGTVNQVMGDGIMALFGAPLAHEDHAVRACYAALRMQESVKRYSEEVRRAAGTPVSIRVGVNSGEVVVRSIGSDLHMDYTAVGQTTHVAARLEQAALPGSILMAADTLRLVEGHVTVKPLGPIQMKGLARPLEVYEAVAAIERTRFQATMSRGLSRFVGRDAVLEQLRQSLQHAAEGRGQMVAVVGEPGVGKSRLYWEFTQPIRNDGWLILESGAASYGKAVPYLPVVDLLKGYFGIGDADDRRAIREKVIRKLLALDRALEPALPAFLALLDVFVEDAQWQALEPGLRRQRTLDAVRRLLLRESQVQPLLVIVHDLQWIDSETQDVLHTLIESLPTARLLLLVNYRPEYQHSWASKSYYMQLRLDPLRPENAVELLQGLLGADASLEALKALLIARTGGNPFFLEESVRTLSETGAIAGDRGAYRLDQTIHAIRIPASVQAVLAARIDRLPPEEKQLLQAAAVIGKDVAAALLQAIAELADEDVRRGITHLQAAEFLHETTLFPELELTFKHALTHDVAYASLLQERRRVLHARLVEVMETLYANRLVDHIDRLADHALRGHVWGKALTYLRRAGHRALERSANREAATFFEHAIEARQHLPKDQPNQEQAIDVRIDLRNALTLLGDPHRMLRHLREAAVIAERVDDQRRLGRVLSFEANCLILLGEHEQAVASGRRALAIAETLDDFSLKTACQQYVARAHESLGDYQRAAEIFTRIVDSLTGELLHEHFGLPVLPAVFSRSHLAVCLAEVGEFGEATRHAEDAVRLAESTDHGDTLFWAYRGAGQVHLGRGDGAQAAAELERALSLCHTRNMPTYVDRVSAELGLAYALCGRTAEAQALIEQTIENATAAKPSGSLPGIVLRSGQVHLLAGRVREAGEATAWALELVQRQRERGNQAYALALFAEVALRRAPADVADAERAYQQAMALAEELGMRPLVARCHLGLGELHRRTGGRQPAREHLTAAATMFHEMHMRVGLENAEAELKELG
jgi:class 3 adenylate cyclase/tetratricopeptide (TPR) repeat protein